MGLRQAPAFFERGALPSWARFGQRLDATWMEHDCT